MAQTYINPPPLPRFSVRFRQLSIRDDVKPVPSWKPPTRHHAFEVDEESRWYEIDLNRVPDHVLSEADELPAGSQLHRSTSMFWCPRRHGFLHINKDCTEANAFNPESGERAHWSALTFEKPKRDDIVVDLRTLTANQNLWKVGHNLRDDYATGPITESWRDLLGPIYLEDGLFTCGGSTSDAPQFAGSFTILFGLVAFATKWDDLDRMIKKAFRCNSSGIIEYIPIKRQGQPEDCGIWSHRGLVIDIFHQPNRCRREEIDQWESGAYGPILISYPVRDQNARQTQPPPQPSQHHQHQHQRQRHPGSRPHSHGNHQSNQPTSTQPSNWSPQGHVPNMPQQAQPRQGRPQHQSPVSPANTGGNRYHYLHPYPPSQPHRR